MSELGPTPCRCLRFTLSELGPMVISMNTHDARFSHFYARSSYEAKSAVRNSLWITAFIVCLHITVDDSHIDLTIHRLYDN